MQKSNRNDNPIRSGISAYFATKVSVCPQCQATELRLSRRSSNHLLRQLFYSPYRCNACHFSFWTLSFFKLFLGGVAVLVVIFVAMILVLEYKHNEVAINSENKAFDDSLLNLAQQGDAKAQLKMGLRYALSPWNTKDDKQAAQWFEKAAEQGQVEAQYRYGYALLKGLGVVQDYKMAFFWLEKAARNGYADAQFALGEMYQLGVFMNSDNEHAYLWFNLAAAQGVKGAASARDLLVKQLSKEQIISLQTEAGNISRNQQSSTQPN
jgi:TPR repeat protein